jgi:hypothetical protein
MIVCVAEGAFDVAQDSYAFPRRKKRRALHDAVAHSADSTAACSSTVCVAFSCCARLDEDQLGRVSAPTYLHFKHGSEQPVKSHAPAIQRCT